MAISHPVDRPRLGVAGTEHVLARYRDPVAAGMRTGIDAAWALDENAAGWWSVQTNLVAAGQSVLLAQHPGGPVLAARVSDPALPTTIHDPAAGDVHRRTGHGDGHDAIELGREPTGSHDFAEILPIDHPSFRFRRPVR